MSDKDTIDGWLSGASDGGQAFALDDNGVCLLAADDGTVVRIEVPEGFGEIVLCGYLARASGIQRAGLHEMLLKANFLNRDTNGATLSIDADADQIALCYRHHIRALDQSSFESLIEGFLASTRRWKSNIAVEEQRRSVTTDLPISSLDEPEILFRL